MTFPDIRELVPHSGPMLLVRRVLEHSAERTVCEVDTADSELFAGADGGVPAWVALEYMAQCAAVHGGLLARASGAPPRAGMLLGTRRLRLEVDRFAPGQVLRVSVACVHAGEQMLSFDAETRDSNDGLVAAARLNVYIAENPGSGMAGPAIQ